MPGGPARWVTAIGLALTLLGCGRIIPETRIPPPAATPGPPPPANALSAGLVPGPAIVSLGLGKEDASGALASFRASCPRLIARDDVSG
ncbi:MAG TPA: hypothetical protein PK680_09880, partial [Novosphingobium sp.]|nr:hypothetical protein [Novosphingobium sp.]